MSPVSVVVPAYNAQNSIVACVESALKEVGNDDEVIVVDDESTDQTREVLLAVTDRRLRVLSNAFTKGPAGARNTAILAARGTYIAFLDADDVWVKGSLSARLKAVENDVLAVGAYGRAVVNSVKGWHTTDCKKAVKKEDIAFSLVSILTPTVIVKRDVALSVGLFNENMLRSQDLDFFLRLLSLGHIVGVDTPCAVVDWAKPRRVADKFESSLPFLAATLRSGFKKSVAERAVFEFVCRGIGLHLRESAYSKALKLSKRMISKDCRNWSAPGFMHVLKGLVHPFGVKLRLVQ